MTIHVRKTLTISVSRDENKEKQPLDFAPFNAELHQKMQPQPAAFSRLLL
jgi:hypothetical protein